MPGARVVAVVVLAAARLAAADAGLDAARAHLAAGIAYYDEARYDEAAREMEAAYRLRPVPELQYNLAQCYERLGRADEAAEAYARYLAGAPRAADRATVETRMRNLAARAAEPKQPGERVVFKTLVVYREAPPPPGRAARWAAYGVGLFALGGLAAGIATAVLAARAADQVKAGANPTMPSPFEGAPRDAQSRGQAEVVISGVGFGVFAVGAVGAGLLYWLGNKIDREAKAVTLAPSLAPGGGALVVGGRF